MKYYLYVEGILIDVFDSYDEAETYAKKFYPNKCWSIISMERRK